ncbi:SpoIIIAH-like family protein [Sporolactobacillus laevolacticus]|uniref:Stage III sporulation protein AH n=1 Tax=Sporolactobacillus laevolacticus DSM 442 TaxID=1395513 RepID=V6IV98_9BACL|nr:SpoIIIAH-like family protein [Sporolactobacillus laevolacticus]EST11062.1 stage III sporulation protein AH [Sporolactobacillus laevolacticus DSM 442]MDF2909802.1 stage sporulation protein [Sporolactobacillus laevolacticus]MDN3956236.1 SpoIIIAH-like family protein [Sporolactobacillus laevolacticus]
MIKKQTVWLLTMLSLIVVLSVYALSTPGHSSDQASQPTADKAKPVAADVKNGKSVTASAAETKLADIELSKDEERAQLEKKYEGVIASGKSSAKEVSAAYDNIASLKTIADNETMLEDVIQSKGFKNSVVKTSGDQVQIFVDSKKLSDQQANQLIQLANEYLGTGRIVSVTYALNQK